MYIQKERRRRIRRTGIPMRVIFRAFFLSSFILLSQNYIGKVDIKKGEEYGEYALS